MSMEEQVVLSLTQKRDQLLVEVADLNKQRDSISKDVQVLNGTQDSFVTEIGELKIKKAKLEENLSSFEQSSADKKSALVREIELLTDKRDGLQSQIKEKEAELASASQTLTEVLGTIKSLVEEIGNVKENVYANITSIKDGAMSVAESIKQVNGMVQDFHTNLTAKEIELNNKSLALDKRQAELDTRELAINVTYDEIIKEMKVQNVDLSELNQKPALS